MLNFMKSISKLYAQSMKFETWQEVSTIHSEKYTHLINVL